MLQIASKEAVFVVPQNPLQKSRRVNSVFEAEARKRNFKLEIPAPLALLSFDPGGHKIYPPGN